MNKSERLALLAMAAVLALGFGFMVGLTGDFAFAWR